MNETLNNVLSYLDREPIRCVDMHTSGEPTRIVYANYPQIHGTLLEKRDKARRYYDEIRRRLLFEPRGHNGMYGAVLFQSTELVDSGDADMGVIFMTGEGYSTMCGHATIALGRFLVDIHDEHIVPNRLAWKHDPETQTTKFVLHAPCGLLEVTVPTLRRGHETDLSRNISFLSVPSFVSGLGVQIPVPENMRWPELGDRTYVTVDISYGGAFFIIVSAAELGFGAGGGFDNIDYATKQLKATAYFDENVRELLQHPEHYELGFVYAVMVVSNARASHRDELGLCFFGNQQFDRSPTGSGVAARVALAYARGERSIGQSWTYESLISRAHLGEGAFIGTPVEEVDVRFSDGKGTVRKGVRVKIEGKAYYTGRHEFYKPQEGDKIGQGFDLKWLLRG